MGNGHIQNIHICAIGTLNGWTCYLTEIVASPAKKKKNTTFYKKTREMNIN